MADAQISGPGADSRHVDLNKLVQERKLFIDTCSVMAEGSDLFWQKIVPLLETYHNKVIFPYRCWQELEKHTNQQQDPQKRERAVHAIQCLTPLIHKKLVDIRGEETDNFADNVFQTVFVKFRLKYKLCLITQDNNLAKDILALNHIKSVKAYSICAWRILQDGSLGYFGWAERFTLSKSKASVPPEEMFDIVHTVNSAASIPVQIADIPGEESEVLISGGAIRLCRTIGAGGEGTLYETNTPYVAKIYKEGKLTEQKQQKIERMLSKNIRCEGVCYPIGAIYNQSHQFVGYLMPKANGRELQKSIFIKPLFLKYFPGWKKKDTVQLCITILNKIQYLHDRNIILGDINPANILVVNPKEVYFVDTDSYQIEGYPCPVGTINYTAPEIQGKEFSKFLRSEGNENFAIATLLFMIMLPGKPPYAQQGGESAADNIRKMDFSYPLGELSNKKTPDGPWRFMWSHLTYKLKEDFYETFHRGGKYSTPSKRLSVGRWLDDFTDYLDLLESGKFGAQDKMSEELFPTRFKKNPQKEYVICKMCGQEMEKDHCIDGYCSACLSKGETYQCERCGKPLLYSNYQKYIKKAKRYPRCKQCYDWGKSVYSQEYCKECGALFAITNDDYEFFTAKGYDLPKRCPACRKKARGYASAADDGINTPPNHPSSSEKEKSEPVKSSEQEGNTSFCFITTAVCEYYGKPDDCMELETLRHYRDSWLRKQPDGPQLIEEYYAIAPDIVRAMQASDKFGLYCEKLWAEYIEPCIDMINERKFEACKKHYINMVRYVQAEFSPGMARAE